ncbi:MAG: hypothetical protein LBI05_05075 [Planctomycetaceae bacterium]|jgi:hypothetical protein|nr:hypothetical protein [Planctomycetaceae bacterium]
MLRSLLLLAVVCCLLANSVSAQAKKVSFVSVGIENCYKNGLWTPITVKYTLPIKQLAIRSCDSDGTPITYRYEVNEKHKVTVLAKMGRKDAPIQISINGGDYTSFDVPPPVNAERPIYLIFGNDDIGLQGAVAELMLREERRPLLVRVKSLADLPTEWFGYESVEMVVLTTTEPALFDGITAESPQIQALNDWLKLGGKMLFCAGKDAGQFLDDETGFLRLFLPGKYDGMTEMRISTPLERFVNSQRQIFMNGTEEAPFMRMPRIIEPRGITVIKDGDLPLVIRCAHGLGTLLYFGGDLSGKPLGNWRDRTTLVRNVLQWNRAQERGSVGAARSGAMLQLGYNDISGQIRSALDQFEGVRIVPFSVILVILTAYWLVIGLFDWFFVHKVLKRPILTWITLPLWIVLFSILTYALAAPGRPNTVKGNRLTIVDTDEEGGVERHSTWQGYYSPSDVRLGLPEEAYGHYNSWYGLPGSGLGGMAPQTVTPPVWQVDSEQSSYSRIARVPVQARSTKSFFGQGSDPSVCPSIDTCLSDEEGVPIGTLEVPDGFPSYLKNCILVYGRWVLELGELLPGQTITVTKTTPRRDLRDLLLPPQTLENETLRRLAMYNPQSTDLEYIVRVMSLYRALGGYASTGLHHAFQPSLDMSDLLSTDRVLLLGIVSLPEWTQSEIQYRITEIYRQSSPITITESSPRWGGERYDPHRDVLEERTRPGYFETETPK